MGTLCPFSMTNDFVYCNEEESEMAQIHSIDLHRNAIAAVQRQMYACTGSKICLACGAVMPLQRQKLVPWARYCIDCATDIEQTGSNR